MNRIKRDYCSKGFHPNWRAWKANYNMSTVQWSHEGNTCVFCNADVTKSSAGSSNNNNKVFSYKGPSKHRRINYFLNEKLWPSIFRMISNGAVFVRS